MNAALRHATFSAILLTGLSFSDPTLAGAPEWNCIIYGPDDKIPARFEGLRTLNSSAAVEICREFSSPIAERVYMLEAPQRSVTGVCYFLKLPVALNERWSYAIDNNRVDFQSKAFMALPQQRLDCALQKSGQYVEVSGVSDGLFLKIGEFVHAMTKENASALLQLSEMPRLAIEETNEFLAAARGARLSLVAIRLTPMAPPIGAHYDITVRVDGTLWSLSADFAGDQLRLFAAGLVLQ